MRTFLITLIGIISCLTLENKRNRLVLIANEINSNPNSTWTATTNFPKKVLEADYSSYFNISYDDPKNITTLDSQPTYTKNIGSYPESLDLREKYPQCKSISLIRDQSSCGSCWAVSAAATISDRICISSNLKDQTILSSADLVSCCKMCGMGCNGGFLLPTWYYYVLKGIVTGGEYNSKAGCMPYPFQKCNHHSEGSYPNCSDLHYETPKCTSTCTNDYEKSYKDDKIKGKTAYQVKGEEAMIKELNENGSVQLAFIVYEDFMTYKSGVYKHTTGKKLGGHAVRLIGYGVENSVKYWLIANSWNDNWGVNGTFKIIRGENNCQIESMGVAGLVSSSAIGTTEI